MVLMCFFLIILQRFLQMAEAEYSRQNFVEHLLRFLVYYGFDGVDIDWEYPTQRGGLPVDKENFVKLLKQLKERLASRKKQVAIAVGASNKVIDEGYDVKGISAIVDYVLLMAYDYHRPDVTSHVAPLNEKPGDNTGSVVSVFNVAIKLSILVFLIVGFFRISVLRNGCQKGVPRKSLFWAFCHLVGLIL